MIDKVQKEPVSEDLDSFAIKYAQDKPYPVTVCQAVKAGAKWKAEQFEKNRLKHCNSITNEQAELESVFIDQHLDKYNRMPTFLDAIEYGMRLQKEQMIEKAINGKVVARFPLASNPLYVDAEIYLSYAKDLKEGSEVKVIVIKED